MCMGPQTRGFMFKVSVAQDMNGVSISSEVEKKLVFYGTKTETNDKGGVQT